MYGLGQDPVSDAIASAKQNVGSAGFLSWLMLLGVAFLVFRPGRK